MFIVSLVFLVFAFFLYFSGSGFCFCGQWWWNPSWEREFSQFLGKPTSSFIQISKNMGQFWLSTACCVERSNHGISQPSFPIWLGAGKENISLNVGSFWELGWYGIFASAAYALGGRSHHQKGGMGWYLGASFCGAWWNKRRHKARKDGEYNTYYISYLWFKTILKTLPLKRSEISAVLYFFFVLGEEVESSECFHSFGSTKKHGSKLESTWRFLQQQWLEFWLIT